MRPSPHDIARPLPAVLLGRLALLTAAAALLAGPARAAWRMYGGDAQHTAVSTVPAQALQVIHWQTPVDLWPQYTGSILYIHYGSPLVTALVNKVLMGGKRSLAQRIVYDALEGARAKTGTDPVVTLKRALDNVKPAIEVKSRRVGGATYQVPVEVKPTRSTTLALRWLVSYSRQRREKTMTERLMNELLDASNGLGASVKRREDTHKMAESNKAFAHYRG